MKNNNPKTSERVGDVVSIFRRSRNWYANFQLNGKQLRKTLGTTSKKEARRRAIQPEAEITQGRYQPVAPAPALASVVEDYLSYLRTEGRATKTLVKYVRVLNRVLDLGRRRRAKSILDVDLRLIDAYRSERVEAGAAPKTVSTESVVVRQLVNFALSRGLIETDPLKGLRLKKPKPRPQPCWTPEEIDQIIEAAPEGDRAKLIVLADTGMRIGELCHLTWVDVDFDLNLMLIRPKANWRPKTGDQRAIPMTPRVRAVLESLPRRHDWVFTAPPSAKYPLGDHQISARRLLASLKRVLKTLGLNGHLHTFRHAFISRALTDGVAEAIVRQWVGHVDAEVMKLYVHVADTVSQAAMKRLDSGKPSLMQRKDACDETETDSAQNQHTRREDRDERDAK